MNLKGNLKIEGQATIETLPITANSLSAVIEIGGVLSKRQLGDISTLPKESYIPGLSVSFPPIFNLNTESLDYNNRSLVASLKNQMQGTSFMAPTNSNGTPAFRRIVKTDLTDANVVFTDDVRFGDFVKKSGDVMSGRLYITKTPTTSFPNNIPSDKDNYIAQEIFSINILNNSLTFFGDGDFNSRRMALQSGHSMTEYCTAYGILELNPFGGLVKSNGYEVWNKNTLSKLSQLTNDLDFVKKSGDTMTGTLKAPAFVLSRGYVGEKGILNNTSGFIYQGASFTYGISVSDEYGGLDIVANQDTQPIRLWSGGTPTKPILSVEYKGNVSNFYSSIDMYNGEGHSTIFINRDSGVINTISHGTSVNWYNAYGWGNHATQGYSKSPNIDQKISINGDKLTLDRNGGTVTLPLGNQIFEVTNQGGLKVKDWISQAGASSIAIGQNSNAIMSNSLALLTGSLAEGNRAISVGFLSQALENDSIAIGSYVTSRGTSFSLGHSIANNQKYCTVVGAFNIDVSNNNPQQILHDDNETPVFVIGSGTSDVVRGNAQITYRDGSTRNFGRQYYDSNMRSVMDFTDPNTLVDVQYISENGSGLTPNPNGLTGSQYSGDVIANPTWLSGVEPDNLSLVYIYVETINGTVWAKFVGTATPTSITAVVGVYLKSHKKILIRGYFVNNLLTTVMHDPWVYNLSNNTANFSSMLPSSYRILGNVINTRNKVIYFNPR